jgi:hypothetical protein
MSNRQAAFKGNASVSRVLSNGNYKRKSDNTVRSESRCALRLRYEDLVVRIEVAG